MPTKKCTYSLKQFQTLFQNTNQFFFQERSKKVLIVAIYSHKLLKRSRGLNKIEPLCSAQSISYNCYWYTLHAYKNKTKFTMYAYKKDHFFQREIQNLRSQGNSNFMLKGKFQICMYC